MQINNLQFNKKLNQIIDFYKDKKLFYQKKVPFNRQNANR